MSWLLACLSLAGGQQMCLYTDNLQSQGPSQVVVFQTASTAFTSTVEDSVVDVSGANTTGQVLIKEIGGQDDILFHLMVTAEGRGQLFVQKNGSVALRGFTKTVSPSGSYMHSGRTVGGEGKLGLPLGVMVLLDGQAQTYEETGLLRPGDNLR